MKRAKVTKKPAARPDLVLRPARLRMFGIYLVLFGLAIGAGLLIRQLVSQDAFSEGWLQNNWLTAVGIIVGGSALMAILERGRWTLRLLNGDKLEGPSGAIGERVVIPAGEIDWERTRKSLNSRVKIGNGIYAANRRILVSPWFFDPREFRSLLEKVGYPKAGFSG